VKNITWIGSMFSGIKVGGKFRCSKNTWIKINETTALKFLGDKIWKNPEIFPRNEMVMTFKKHLKPTGN
jgi:hypothetical protein